MSVLRHHQMLMAGSSWSPRQLDPIVWIDHTSVPTYATGSTLISVLDNVSSRLVQAPGLSRRPETVAAGLNGRRIYRFAGGTRLDVEESQTFISSVDAAWCAVVFRSSSVDNAYRYLASITVYSNNHNALYNVMGSEVSAINCPGVGGRGLVSDAYSAVKQSASVGTNWTVLVTQIDYATKTGYYATDGAAFTAGTMTNMTAGTRPVDSHSKLIIASDGEVNRFFNGDIAEVIFGNSKLPPGAEIQLGAYLKNKWGL